MSWAPGRNPDAPCAVCDRPRRGHRARSHRFADRLSPSAALDKLLWALVDEAAPSHLQPVRTGNEPLCSASCSRCRLVGALETYQRSRRKR